MAPTKSSHICNLSICRVRCTTIQPITVSIPSQAKFNEKESGASITHVGIAFVIVSVVELACGEYGLDKIKTMVESMENGECIDWFQNPSKVLNLGTLRKKYPLKQTSKDQSLEPTSSMHQLSVLLRRGWIKTKRDATLTHLRYSALNLFHFIKRVDLYVLPNLADIL